MKGQLFVDYLANVLLFEWFTKNQNSLSNNPDWSGNPVCVTCLQVDTNRLKRKAGKAITDTDYRFVHKKAGVY